MAPRIVFCGVGALGSNAVMACRNLDARLAFVDFDRVESKNTLAQAFVKTSLGKNKADALRAQLLAFHGVKADAFGVRLAEENVATLCGDADLLVDAFDNAKSRRLLAAFARANGKPLVHAAVSGDGTFGLVRWDERFEADEEDTPGQATCQGGEHAPLIALVAATLARCIQDHVRTGVRWDALVGLRSVTVTSGA